MPSDRLIALTTLMLAMFWTPGPNNALLAASGLRFGFRRSLAHLLGVSLGFALMLLMVACGFGALFRAWPVIVDVLRWTGIALLLWMAWKIAASDTVKTGDTGARPWTFLQATAFQWVNPKGWVICIAVISQFVTGNRPVAESAWITGLAIVTGTMSAIGWVGFGVLLQRWLTSPARLRAFNLSMAALIVGSVGLMFVE